LVEYLHYVLPAMEAIGGPLSLVRLEPFKAMLSF
jgi:hypothetical protein